MAYRFSTGDEPVSNQIHRIFLEEIDAAIHHLQSTNRDNRDHRIHEVRKNIKKIRALLRLLSPQLEKRDFHHENRRFRDIGRKISKLRDAQAMIESFSELPESALTPKLKSALLKQLESQKAQVYTCASVDEVLKSTVLALAEARPHLAAVSVQKEGTAILKSGLLHTYRECRKALRHAREDRSAERFHDFRKRVKDHWYHTRLLKESPLEFLRGRQGALRELETLLGDAHNLNVLQATFRESPADFRLKSAQKLLGNLETREKDLGTHALLLGESLFALECRKLKRELRALEIG